MDIDSLEAGQLLTDEVFLVAEARLGVDRRGQNYYSLTLNTEGGRQIEGKVWSDSIGAEIKSGVGLEVLARVDEYRGQKQLNIQRYTVLKPDEYDLSPYVRHTDVDVEAAFETLFDWDREEFSNPYLKKLMAELHSNNSFATAFMESPAASFHHHNYQGGLIEHTLEVWNLADRICGLYADKLDRDLVLCAAATHDVGKINTYELNTGISQRTETGELLDHIFISGSMLSNLWDSAVKPSVPPENAGEAAHVKTLLLHVVLSHHGKLEWGSPVLPRTPEALLIHHCDVLSATMHSSFGAIEAAPEGEPWTDKVYIMDAPRRLLVPKSVGANVPEAPEE